jgi:hypothetical protein
MAELAFISFGYGHAAPPPARITIDVREHFRDPHVNPALRRATAEDPRVVAAVLDTPGVGLLIASLAGVIAAYAAGRSPAPLTVAIGCAGGRHRSAVIAAELARHFAEAGVTVSLVHRDIARPVIERSPATDRNQLPQPGTQEDDQFMLGRDRVNDPYNTMGAASPAKPAARPRKEVVMRLVKTAVAHDAVAAANGWQDNTETERLARAHRVARNGATAAEIAAYEYLIAGGK